MENKKKEKWLKKNAGHSQLLAPWVIPIRPDIGEYLRVDKLDIPGEFFPDEFKAISEAYYSVLRKLEKYYKERKT